MSSELPGDQAIITDGEIAIIGMAGRFPGARNINQFWENLRAGIESISFFTEEELVSSGVDPSLLANENYVRAAGSIGDVTEFDAGFFDFTKKEAEITDPQQRLFLECVWQALEDAGCCPDKTRYSIGVYAGTRLSHYLLNLYSNPELIDKIGGYRILLGNDKDYLPTIVSYKLNLKGPSVAIQTACSTSLVAVHMACRDLIDGNCDVAIAGAASIRLPDKAGYLYQEGGIASPDGHCRAFSADAKGTVAGSGVAAVVLKRLEDSIRDRDHIYAVIKGSAINNDGSEKVGFTAPSIDGQAGVIADALAMAGVGPETISYVEAHGTGTPLGDPIEISALSKVFAPYVKSKSTCAVGSIKTNLGHLDTAAGLAGLLKVALCLKHKQIVPSLHFDRPNPKIDFASGPFYVNTELAEWKTQGGPRRAGVSSFGIGGTNAHIIVEEAPRVKSSRASNVPRLLTLSAKTDTALKETTENLARHLEQAPAWNTGDLSFTLQVGRRDFSHRSIVVCKGRDDVLDVLKSCDPRRVVTRVSQEAHCPVMFMFPGQGAQHPRMAAETYEHEPYFRGLVDYCSEFLESRFDIDPRKLIYANPDDAEGADQLKQTQAAQLSLFVIEYALARLWMKWIGAPSAMIGHSLGEYTAACLSGVISLEDALTLVGRRATLMQQLPGGSMLSVPLSEAEMAPFLNGRLSLAAVNGPSLCVVSGPNEEVARFQNALTEREIRSRLLHTSHAFHSMMMEPAMAPFTEVLGGVTFNSPKIPYISNLTGTWISWEQVTRSDYWSRHLRSTVRFADGLAELLKGARCLLLEVGPGQTLSHIARHSVADNGDVAVVSSMAGQADESDYQSLLYALGRAWLEGVRVDWHGFNEGHESSRITLPTYPFERKRYWIEPGSKGAFSPSGVANHNEHTEGRSRDLGRSHVGSESEALMSEGQNGAQKQPNRRDKIVTALKVVANDLAGVDPQTIDPQASFLELGVDSLLLVQVAQAIEDEFKVKMPFRMLFQEAFSLDALADHLVGAVSDEYFKVGECESQSPQPASPPEISALQHDSTDVDEPAYRAPAPQEVSLPNLSVTNPATSPGMTGRPDSGSIRNIMSQHLQVMNRLLDMLSGEPGCSSEAASIPQRQPAPCHTSPTENLEPAHSMAPNQRPQVPTVGLFRPGTDEPLQPRELRASTSITPHQQRFLDEFAERYNERTRESKGVTQRYRPVLAEPRAAVGFRLLTKELTYPIIAQRSRGSRIWDLDGNEYVDIAMGFGVNLLGHAPSFVRDALAEQLEKGFQLGPQSDVAGEVAELLCDLTGMQRAIFCNSGTEAVMAAMRIARTVTRRQKIVLFAGSYHGSFDATLGRPVKIGGKLSTAPSSPGVTPGMVEDLIVLDYGAPESLDFIRQHCNELAAVLVEPVQSRRPAYQPVEFLRLLRGITESAGTALIFDEVVTGFRIHQGGAQALFGIQADIATYGKVVGGGMPIGVVAGKAGYMDAIDGGMWNFGDDSYPQAEQTFFAGTFCKHPMSMAAARAVLRHLKAQGPALQEGLNRRASDFAGAIRSMFEQSHVPIEIDSCGSLMYLRPSRKNRFIDLLFYQLIARGVYNWEGHTCFLSTAHTEGDIALVLGAVEESIAAMGEGHLLPEAAGSSGRPAIVQHNGANRLTMEGTAGVGAQAQNETPQLLPLADAQQQVWALAQMGEEVSRAYHESVSIRMSGPLDIPSLHRAIQSVVDRHASLRSSISVDGSYQVVHPTQRLKVPLVDFSFAGEDRRQAELSKWILEEAREPFDLVSGPLVRASVGRLHATEHVFVVTTHHIITDGASYGVLIKELSDFYSAYVQGRTCELPAPSQVTDYSKALIEDIDPDLIERDRAYWLSQFSDGVPNVELPSDRPRPLNQTYGGDRCTLAIEGDLLRDLKAMGARAGSTLFMTLLAGFNVLIYQLTGQDDIVVGFNAVSTSSLRSRNLIGYRLNPLALRCKAAGDPTFIQYLAAVKIQVLDAYDHQGITARQLNKELMARQGSKQRVAVKIVFNLDQGGTEQGFHGLRTEVVSNFTGSAKLDLYLNAIDSGQQLDLDCDYNSDLFNRETIQHWLHHYRQILEGVAADPGRRLSELPVILAKRQTARQDSRSLSPSQLGTGDQSYGESNLTRHQLYLWLAQQLNPGLLLRVDNAGLVFITGDLSYDHFQRAAQALIDDSDALRTVVREVDGIPVQSAIQPLKYQVEVLDFSGHPSARDAVKEWATTLSRLPLEPSERVFDLRLARLSDVEHAFYMNLHHLVADAWASGVFVRLLSEYYRMSLEGRLGDRRRPREFSHQVQREKEYLASPRATKAKKYWDDKLEKAIEPLNLYGNGSVGKGHKTERLAWSMGPQVSGELRAATRRAFPSQISGDGSLSNVLAGLLAAYLYRVGGNSFLSIGNAFHNRTWPESDRVIGLFVQSFPMHLTVDREDSFVSLINKVGREQIRDLRHAQYPVGNPQKQAYEVEFNFVKAPFLARFADLPVKREWIHSGEGNETLVLHIVEGEQGDLTCEFDLHLDIFGTAEKETALRHFQLTVMEFLRDACQPVSGLSLISGEEKLQVISGFAKPTEQAADTRSLVGKIFEQALARCDAIAVKSGDQWLTYGLLKSRVERLAASLASRGVGPETIVGVMLDRDVNFLFAVMAAWRAGGAYLPLDSRQPRERLSLIVGQSQCPVILATDDNAARISAALETAQDAEKPTVLVIDQLLNELTPAGFREQSSPANSLSYVIYTSGSTGIPKGAMVEQIGMLNHLRAKIEDLDLSENDLVAQTATQYFDISVWQFFAALMSGGRILIVDDLTVLDPIELLNAVDRDGATILEIVPSQLREAVEMLAASGHQAPKLSSLRRLVVTGEALTPGLCGRWFSLYPQIPLVNAYGPTECSDDVTHQSIGAAPQMESARVPIGNVLSNLKAFVLDPSMSSLPMCVPGEAHFGGIGVGRGYLNDPFRTAPVFVPDPFAAEPGARLYKSGDLCRFLPGGALDFLGRIDHQVKVRGYRIELADIESALAKHEAVKETAVQAREDIPGNKRLVAYVVPREPKAANTGEFRDFLRMKLPEYMIPAAFVIIDRMPLNSNGKIDLRSLPVPGETDFHHEANLTEPRTETERILAAIWQEVLGVKKVGINDDFFQLGGDSILAIRIVSKAHQAGLNLSPKQVFQYFTIADLASAAGTHRTTVAEQRVVTGPVPLTPIQRWFFEQDFEDRHYWNQAVLLELRKPLNPQLLEKAVSELIRHHDALRLRFVQAGSEWRQSNSQFETAPLMATVDLSKIFADEQAASITAACTELQQTLNLSEGPLIRFALIDLGANRPGRLMIAVHHLAVDGVSWPIILEDLQTAYEQLENGAAVRLPAKTTSYKTWSERLVEYAGSPDLLAELSYWLDGNRLLAAGFKPDYSSGSNTSDALETIKLTLNERETKKVLTDLPTAVKVDINTVLLTALADAFCSRTGSKSLLVNLEFHGREPIFDDLDLSRTVGWFTSIFPLLVDLGSGVTTQERLSAVQRQLRKPRNNGIGYAVIKYLSSDAAVARQIRAFPEPPVSFNYLGQFDQAVSSGSLFKLADESPGPTSRRSGLRKHLIDINVIVVQGKLQTVWAFSRNVLRPSTVEALANAFHASLRGMISSHLSDARAEANYADFNWNRKDREKMAKVINRVHSQRSTGD